MENFVKTSLHLVKNLEAFPCALKKDPAVYREIEKKVQATGKNFEKNRAVQIKKQSENST